MKAAEQRTKVPFEKHIFKIKLKEYTFLHNILTRNHDNSAVNTTITAFETVML